MECANIYHANRYPHPRLALIVIRQKDRALPLDNTGEVFSRAPAQLKAERITEVGDARVHVLNAKNGDRRT
jgi:hypothetical protein